MILDLSTFSDFCILISQYLIHFFSVLYFSYINFNVFLLFYLILSYDCRIFFRFVMLRFLRLLLMRFLPVWTVLALVNVLFAVFITSCHMCLIRFHYWYFLRGNKYQIVNLLSLTRLIRWLKINYTLVFYVFSCNREHCNVFLSFCYFSWRTVLHHVRNRSSLLIFIYIVLFWSKNFIFDCRDMTLKSSFIYYKFDAARRILHFKSIKQLLYYILIFSDCRIQNHLLNKIWPTRLFGHQAVF